MMMVRDGGVKACLDDHKHEKSSDFFPCSGISIHYPSTVLKTQNLVSNEKSYRYRVPESHLATFSGSTSNRESPAQSTPLLPQWCQLFKPRMQQTL